MEQKRKSPKRLILNIDEKTHHTIREKALAKNITLRVWVLRAIHHQMRKEDQYMKDDNEAD